MIENVIEAFLFTILSTGLLVLIVEGGIVKLRSGILTYFFSMLILYGMVQSFFDPITVGILLFIVNFTFVLFLRLGNSSYRIILSTAIGILYFIFQSIDGVFLFDFFNMDTLDISNLNLLMNLLTMFSQIAILISCLVSVWMIIKIVKNKTAGLFWIGLLSLDLLIPVFCLYADILTIHSKPYNLLIFVILIVSIYQFVLLIFVNKILYAQQRDNQLLINGTMLQKYMQELNEQRTLIDKRNHDHQNHMIGIKYLLENEEYSKCRDYLDQIHGNDDSVKPSFNTGNRSADMVLSSLASKYKDVRINVHQPIPETDRILMIDFVSLLFNLVENACEAAIETNDKNVNIKVTMNQSHYFIQVVNSSIRNPIPTNFISTKASESHGFGMSIIRDIIQKYKGEIYSSFDHGVFTQRIQIIKHVDITQ